MAVDNVKLAILGSSIGVKIPLKLWNITRSKEGIGDTFTFKQIELHERTGKDCFLEHFWNLILQNDHSS